MSYGRLPPNNSGGSGAGASRVPQRPIALAPQPASQSQSEREREARAAAQRAALVAAAAAGEDDDGEEQALTAAAASGASISYDDEEGEEFGEAEEAEDDHRGGDGSSGRRGGRGHSPSISDVARAYSSMAPDVSEGGDHASSHISQSWAAHSESAPEGRRGGGGDYYGAHQEGELDYAPEGATVDEEEADEASWTENADGPDRDRGDAAAEQGGAEYYDPEAEAAAAAAAGQAFGEEGLGGEGALGDDERAAIAALPVWPPPGAHIQGQSHGHGHGHGTGRSGATFAALPSFAASAPIPSIVGSGAISSEFGEHDAAGRRHGFTVFFRDKYAEEVEFNHGVAVAVRTRVRKDTNRTALQTAYFGRACWLNLSSDGVSLFGLLTDASGGDDEDRAEAMDAPVSGIVSYGEMRGGQFHGFARVLDENRGEEDMGDWNEGKEEGLHAIRTITLTVAPIQSGNHKAMEESKWFSQEYEAGEAIGPRLALAPDDALVAAALGECKRVTARIVANRARTDELLAAFKARRDASLLLRELPDRPVLLHSWPKPAGRHRLVRYSGAAFDGEVYTVGAIKKSWMRPHGWGRMLSAALGRTLYEGTWLHGCHHGYGARTLRRSVYEGEMVRHRIEGVGWQYWPPTHPRSGAVSSYLGSMSLSLSDGVGRLRSRKPGDADEYVFDGVFRSSEKHGIGLLRKANKCMLGNWHHEYPQGYHVTFDHVRRQKAAGGGGAAAAGAASASSSSSSSASAPGSSEEPSTYGTLWIKRFIAGKYKGKKEIGSLHPLVLNLWAKVEQMRQAVDAVAWRWSDVHQEFLSRRQAFAALPLKSTALVFKMPCDYCQVSPIVGEAFTCVSCSVHLCGRCWRPAGGEPEFRNHVRSHAGFERIQHPKEAALLAAGVVLAAAGGQASGHSTARSQELNTARSSSTARSMSDLEPGAMMPAPSAPPASAFAASASAASAGSSAANSGPSSGSSTDRSASLSERMLAAPSQVLVGEYAGRVSIDPLSFPIRFRFSSVMAVPGASADEDQLVAGVVTCEGVGCAKFHGHANPRSGALSLTSYELLQGQLMVPCHYVAKLAVPNTTGSGAVQQVMHQASWESKSSRGTFEATYEPSSAPPESAAAAAAARKKQKPIVAAAAAMAAAQPAAAAAAASSPAPAPAAAVSTPYLQPVTLSEADQREAEKDAAYPEFPPSLMLLLPVTRCPCARAVAAAAAQAKEAAIMKLASAPSAAASSSASGSASSLAAVTAAAQKRQWDKLGASLLGGGGGGDDDEGAVRKQAPASSPSVVPLQPTGTVAVLLPLLQAALNQSARIISDRSLLTARLPSQIPSVPASAASAPFAWERICLLLVSRVQSQLPLLQRLHLRLCGSARASHQLSFACGLRLEQELSYYNHLLRRLSALMAAPSSSSAATGQAGARISAWIRRSVHSLIDGVEAAGVPLYQLWLEFDQAGMELLELMPL